MKGFLRSLPAKAACFILLTLTLATFVLCVWAALYFSDNGFYTQTPHDRLYSTLGASMSREGLSVAKKAFAGSEYNASGSNLLYAVYNEAGELLFTNSDDPEKLDYIRYYGVKNGAVQSASATRKTEEYFRVRMALNESFPESDGYAFWGRLIVFASASRYRIVPIGAAAGLASIVLFLLLMSVSARRPGTEELCPGVLNPVPLEIVLAACVAGGFGAYRAVKYVSETYERQYTVVAAVVCGLIVIALLLGLSMSVAARIKQKTVFRNTVVFLTLKYLWLGLRAVGRGFSKIPMIFKTFLLLIGVSAVELAALVLSDTVERYLIFWIVEKVIAVPLVLWVAFGLKRIKTGGSEILRGNTDYKIDERGLPRDLREHAGDINGLASGILTAVEERTRSERLKTELITNVSHDIKTPLTSIINYTDLIGREPCDNGKITEYSAVLKRQSERLKRLIEDLVEASKASTGNLEVDLEPMELDVFMAQAAAEYEEKLNAAGLTLCMSIYDENVTILADGRRLWRVFDNLMNNICKYAQRGTRVYLDLRADGSTAEVEFKNTSRDKLNVTPDELMERFVRGDASRHTEGNGLGLSIARSMTELQGGELRLAIDGDLFKAAVRFKRM